MESNFKNSLITATGALVTTGLGTYIIAKQFPNGNNSDDWKVVGTLGAVGSLTSAYGSTMSLPAVPAWLSIGVTALKGYLRL